MKSLTREAILRMTGTESGSGIGTPVTGGGGNTAGFASESWVDENYIGKDFFNEIFEIQGKKTTTIGSGTPVKVDYVFEPNELPETKTTTEGGVTTTVKTEITKIKIKAGAYTDSFLSALGLGTGGGSGSTSALYNLIDVKPNAGNTNVYGLDGTSADNGKVLTYSTSYGKWIAQTVQSGGGGTVTSITAGTGLSGGTITMTGTIAINSTYQTYISHGETAYGWGNHANAGYLTGINSTMINTALGFTLSGTAGETYDLDAFLTSVAFADLSSTPTTLSGYGITDAVDNSTKWWGASISNGAVTGAMTSVGDITLDNNSRISTGSGNTTLYIGNSDNGGWVKLQDVCSASGNSNWAIYADGHANLGDLTMNYEGSGGARFIYFGGNSFYIKKMNNRFVLSTNGTETINVYDDQFYCTTKIHTVVGLESEGYVTCLSQSSASDERMKNIVENFSLKANQIADAPIVKFTWKDSADKSVHAGSIAQYWQKVLPENVIDLNGRLSLEYGALALISSISLAREVVNLKQTIARLEKELSKYQN